LTGVQTPFTQVTVYFAWPVLSGSKPEICRPSQRVRLLPAQDGDDNHTFRYAARVPSLDQSRIISGLAHLQLPNTVPMADVFVVATGASAQDAVTFTANIGISTPWMALLGAATCGVAVWFCLILWANNRHIKGGRFLRVIATPNGIASLSQFQILIWTFVIGMGVVYVMMLSGNLIDIPNSTLGLLGITGFALVGSKLSANSDGSPQMVNAPGAVTALSVVGNPTSDTVVLSWQPPAGTPQPFSYTIQMRAADAGMWVSVAHGIGAPPYAVIGLTPATSYQFQVFAMNAAGAGPAAVPLSAATAPAAAGTNAAAAPSQVTGVTAIAEQNGTVRLNWSSLMPQPGGGYVVQYRQAGTLPWVTTDGNSDSPRYVAGLNSNTKYEFQVFAVTAGIAGAPSYIVIATTAQRLPRWSDLVMSDDGSATEVDMSRLQMLVFTTITAVFTAITLLNTGVIPDLPLGELALVGISNGVYLASKLSGSGGRQG
jgi:hypothetical protein